MSDIVGCCGIVCSNCDIYKATKTDYSKLREIIFQRQIEWGHGDRFRKLYGREYSLEDIHCSGCPIENELDFWYIENCRMRACALEKNLENCAYCRGYPCEKLQAFFDKSHVNAKKTLDEIHSQIMGKR